jgi:1-acyl-sn-glycerol-3-phosphate acyltransferase
MESKFDDIAPLYDHEVSATIEELLSDPGFIHAIRYVLPNMNQEDFAREMRSYKTKREFQSKMISPFIWGIVYRTSTSVSLTGWENFDRDKQYLFISNHRDIILDAGILNISFNDEGLNTTEIAIGDNLLVFPWIKKLVRLNKSFIVQRGVSVRQMLEVSKRLSEYIHYAVKRKKESIWLAQREGRAKDSADRTQESLLKMLTLFPEKGGFINNLKELNIIPLSISYEYDPCDYLKAQEFQLKRDNPEYKKTQRDDLLNMETGLLGFKGNIHFRFGRPINDKLEALKDIDRKLQISAAAQCIDDEIHANYKIFPGNYVAYDLLAGENRFAGEYSTHEKNAFEDYISNQIAKIKISGKDESFLKERMLVMYSNILKNYLLTVNV